MSSKANDTNGELSEVLKNKASPENSMLSPLCEVPYSECGNGLLEDTIGCTSDSTSLTGKG